MSDREPLGLRMSSHAPNLLQEHDRVHSKGLWDQTRTNRSLRRSCSFRDLQGYAKRVAKYLKNSHRIVES